MERTVSGINPEFQKSLLNFCDIVEMKLGSGSQPGWCGSLFGICKKASWGCNPTGKHPLWVTGIVSCSDFFSGPAEPWVFLIYGTRGIFTKTDDARHFSPPWFFPSQLRSKESATAKSAPDIGLECSFSSRLPMNPWAPGALRPARTNLTFLGSLIHSHQTGWVRDPTSAFDKAPQRGTLGVL